MISLSKHQAVHTCITDRVTKTDDGKGVLSPVPLLSPRARLKYWKDEKDKLSS